MYGMRGLAEMGEIIEPLFVRVGGIRHPRAWIVIILKPILSEGPVHLRHRGFSDGLTEADRSAVGYGCCA